MSTDLILSDVFKTRKGRHVYAQRTICEVHREIYDILVTSLQNEPETLKRLIPKLEEAYLMGIKMTKKMVENKIKNLDWEKNTKEGERLRKLRIELENEVVDSI